MNTRTMAFQVDEALFRRIKAHLTRTGLTQRAFVISVIEDALTAAEAAASDYDAEPTNDLDDAAETDAEVADDATDDSEPDTDDDAESGEDEPTAYDTADDEEE